jgi:hypothetical protein
MGLPKIPFTPQTASINRIRIVDLPGIHVDDSVIGEQAYNLLSAPAIVHYMLSHARDLNLPSGYMEGDPNRSELRRDLPLLLDQYLTSSDPVVRNCAEKIAERLGRNLGYLLLTLHRGDIVNRLVRPDWTTQEWDQWHNIRNIIIGGGLASGHLGDRLLAAAQSIITRNRYMNLIHINKSAYPRTMTVVGASRYFPIAAKNALCLDFGQTSVKAATVKLQQGSIKSMSWLPTHFVSWHWRNDTEARNEIQPQEVLNFVVDETTSRWQQASETGIPLDSDIIMSIAAYVRDEKLLGNGIYARMSLLTEDVQAMMQKHVWDQGNIKVRIHFIHDGTAAAAVYAGSQKTAVLVFGTAIGVGFAPESAACLRSIGADVPLL